MTAGSDERTIGAYGARLDGHDAELALIREDLQQIRDSLKALEQVAQFGQGVLWMLLKIGGAIAAAVGLYKWLGTHS